MANWRYTNKEETGVQNLLTGGSCLQGSSRMWKDFQAQLAGGGQVDPWIDKQGAMDLKLSELNDLILAKEKEPFFYAPKNLNFFLDHDLVTKKKIRAADKNTLWRSADKEVDGIKRKSVIFNKQEMSDFADAVIDRGEEILEVKFFHDGVVQDLFLDELTTYQDILDYDISTDWPV